MPKQQKKTLSVEDKRDLRKARREALPKFGRKDAEICYNEKFLDSKQERLENEPNFKSPGLAGLQTPLKQQTIAEAQKEWWCSQKRAEKKAYALQRKREYVQRKALNLPKHKQTLLSWNKTTGPFFKRGK